MRLLNWEPGGHHTGARGQAAPAWQQDVMGASTEKYSPRGIGRAASGPSPPPTPRPTDSAAGLLASKIIPRHVPVSRKKRVEQSPWVGVWKVGGFFVS